ncbi:MAG: 1-pyrroline-5-carboxylate dehydrogenase [Desulfobacterales bacterium]|nr:MAG: 1-pyrroline-5-carboxylate dehydrogenase [Desulfobacterales bacterium]
MSKGQRITYATMTADNEALHAEYDVAISQVKESWLGVQVPMFINGEKIYTEQQIESTSPIDTDLLLCKGQVGGVEHAESAIKAARDAFPGWRDTPWQERVAILRNIAGKVRENSLELSAIIILEVGKNRLEALGEVEEIADLIDYYADSMEKNQGFVNELGKYDPDDAAECNLSVLLPYGVWAVISPYNFPMALSAAPIAAALVCGNTVVFKGASDTPYSCWKTVELFVENGLPAGVLNYVSGPGRTVGQAIQDSLDVDGWTFTGSYDVGMKLYQKAASGPHPRPAIIEMGGKNPVIVSPTADIKKAAGGVMRSAFGLDGQKCSACSRVYIHERVFDAFTEELLKMTRQIKISDPCDRDCYMGTVINKKAYDRYKKYTDMARADGEVLHGGNILTDGDFAKGYFVEPTIVTGLAEDHPLVKDELFLPIVHLTRVASLDEGMEKANDIVYGLTAGFFGENDDELAWFLKNIQAGTVYTNRAAGATTGAWPGIQVFGGWKGSGSTGKGIGGLYTLALYMHEQSRTLIDWR